MAYGHLKKVCAPMRRITTTLMDHAKGNHKPRILPSRRGDFLGNSCD